MKKTIFAALLAALTAVSCTLEITPSNNGDQIPDGYKIVTLSAVQGKETKTAYEGDVTFSWTSGDAISVYCTDASVPANTGFYTFTTDGSGASATFTGTIPGTAEVGDVALFPASASHAYEGGIYKFNVDADKSFLSHESADIPMYGAKDGSGNFAFTHLAGAFKLNVDNVPDGVDKVKISFTAASSKMSGQFDITGSGPYTWAPEGGSTEGARTVSRECNVTSNAFTVYFPYTTGTIWGNSTITIKDYTGDVEGSTLFTNDAVGAFPVTRKKVTRLGTLSCEYRSAYGIDWSGISAAETSTGAINKLKATMDGTYFYVYMEIDPSKLDLTHAYDHGFYFYASTSGDRTSLWSDSSKTSKLLSSVWAAGSGSMGFIHWQGGSIVSSVSNIAGKAIYEVRIDRSFNSLISQTSTPIKFGVVLDDNYHDGEHQYSRGTGNYGVIPEAGSAMYSIPQYVEPTPSSTVATASSVSKNFRESLTETVNPERGMYRHNEYHFTGGSVNKTSVTCESDMTLTLLIFYLEDFMSSANLSAGALTNIRTILSNVRSQGKKAILRFAYNNEYHVKTGVDPVTGDDIYEDVNPREPETLSYITNHIHDLAGVFEDYKDVIYLVQAGFLGTYGEWYYTTTTGTPLFPMGWSVSGSSIVGFDNRNTVLAKILTEVPNTIQVALRTPFYKRFYLSPDSVDSWSTISSWDGTDDNSRLSFHNDAFLAGADDLGTFHYYAPSYSLDKDMWKSQSPKLAIGGEVAFRSLAKCDPAYYALEPALEAIEEYNYSYLNDASGNNEIIQYWVSRDEYPIIRKAIGYRLVLNNLSITPAGTYASGQIVNFSLKVSNTGSASVIYPRPCKLVLLHGSTPTVLKDLTAAHDVRDITPGSNYTYIFDITLPQNICEGDGLAIWMPDKTAELQSTAAYSIRLSNNDVTWDNGYNVIHTF